METPAEKVLVMVAGPELNMLIAEQVLGHRWLCYYRYPGEWVRFMVAPSLVADLTKEYELWSPETHPEARIIAARHVLSFATLDYDFSRSTADAWQVVEKLTADGWGHKHLVLSAAAECPGWQWTFMRPGGGLGAGIAGAEADTAPLAICRAALLTTLKA